MARQLPSDKFAIVHRRRVALVWHRCRICGVSFKWEPFFQVFSERDLRFPTDEDKSRGIVRFFPYPESQTVCIHCAKQFGIAHAASFPVDLQAFDALIDKMHAGDPPLPVHDNTKKKMSIVSRDAGR